MNHLFKSARVTVLATIVSLTGVAKTTFAQSETAPAEQVKVSLEVRRVPPGDKALPGESRIDEHVTLIVENESKVDFPIPHSLDQLWKVSLHKESTEPEPWKWFATTPETTSLPPGRRLRLEGGWEFPKGVEPGPYVVEAEFVPTGEKQTARFVVRPPLTAEVLFTGKLMGYYRLPDQQTFTTASPEKPCLPPPADKGKNEIDRPERQRMFPSDDAQAFIDHYRGRDEASLLVGTGDNFSPNYYSRVLMDAPTEAPLAQGSAPVPLAPNKELWNWDPRARGWTWYDRKTSPATVADLQEGTSTIGRDNVGCFLSYMHYDAVVPGKHDFYYGPERLRQLARFMASIPKDDNDSTFRPVQMLAANMMMKTTWAKDHVPIPDSGKHPLPFVTKYTQTPRVQNAMPIDVAFRDLKIEDFTDGGFAFPWMQFVRVSAEGWPDSEDLKNRLQVFLCEAVPGDPDDFLKRDGFCNNHHLLTLDRDATVAAERGIDATAQAKMTSREKLGPPDKKKSRSQSLVYRIASPASLVPGHNYAICVPAPEVTVENRDDEAATKAPPYCFRFSVYNPFFQFPGFGNPPPATYRDPDLYVLREDGPAPVVVFGVVAPELLEHIGGDNFAWETVRGVPGGKVRMDKRFTTKLTISDPVLALVHLQDYFEKQYRDKPPHKDFQGIRVLLAQMPPAEAKQLAEHLPGCLRFDLIISEGDDALASPNQVLQIKPATMTDTTAENCPTGVGEPGLSMRDQSFVNGALAKPATMIVVPPTHEQSPPDHLSRLLQVRDLEIKEDGHTYWNYALSGEPIPVPVPATDTNGLKEVSNAFWLAVCHTIYPAGAKDCDPIDHETGISMVDPKFRANALLKDAATVRWDTAVKDAAMEQLALWAMRQKSKVDVALLQRRDFYNFGFDDYLADHCITGPKNEKCDSLREKIDVQEVLDRIIWKGDYIRIRSVQGGVLKSMLKQSDQFSKIDKTAYMSVNETGRALVHLGLSPDVQNGGDYLVNGRPLDPNALYSVATSDYISLGDTGYPDIATPPVGNPPVPASSSKPLIPISASACDELKVDSAAKVYLDQKCRKEVNPDEYYDELANRFPDDPRKGNTSWHKFYAWTFLHGNLGQPAKQSGYAPTGPADVASETQKREDSGMNWDFAADKLSIGFSGLTHNTSEQTLSREFAGVQNAQVNAKHSHLWDWDANSKLTFFHPLVDWFTSETLQYSSSFVSQLSGPASETQSRNQFAVDGGPYFHLPLLHVLRRSKNLPQLSLVPSAHFETQVGNPITNVNLSSPPLSSPSTLTFKQGRTDLLLGRLGIRFQNRKSYVEGGFEGGKTLNAIQQFNVLTAPGGPVVMCALVASVSLTKCLNNFNKNNPLTPVTAASTVSVVRRPQDRYGAYWTMGTTVPINPTISYNFQQSSDYFFLSTGDNSADTRFRHQLVHTLKFAVLPNLFFEPTYTLFLYENKLDYHFLVQQQYSIKINYSFDWSNLHGTGQQLRYKKPSPQ
jgi:hypothetical protein